LEFSRLKAYLIVPILSVCSLLIFPWLLYHKAPLRAKVFYNPVNGLDRATHILVTDVNGKVEIKDLYSTNTMNTKDTFLFRFIQFKFILENNRFEPVEYDCTMYQYELLKRGKGLKQESVNELRMLYGPCQLVVPKKPIGSLLIHEVLNPFYIF